jgi:hypothetical protein
MSQQVTPYDPDKDSPVLQDPIYKNTLKALTYALENAKLYTDDTRSADVWDYAGTQDGVQTYIMKPHIMQQKNVVGRVAVRGTCTVKVPAHVMINALVKQDQPNKDPLAIRQQWDPSLIGYKVIKDFGGYALSAYTRYKSPSFMFSDRDFVWLRDACLNVDPTSGHLQSFYLCGTSLSPKDDQIKCPGTDGAVRGETYVSSWVVKPFDESACRVEIVADVDVSVSTWMPESVYKWISSDNIESLVRMKRIAESK